MKLFYFETPSYGIEACVMAESLEDAKEYVRAKLVEEEYGMTAEDEMVNGKADYKGRYYRIRGLGIGEVVITEVS